LRWPRSRCQIATGPSINLIATRQLRVSLMRLVGEPDPDDPLPAFLKVLGRLLNVVMV
jgi:hypothetical protein